MPHRYMALAAREPVTLDNCDREPIHVPGHIQAHGALFAFGKDGLLQWVSAGAQAVLGVAVPALGESVGALHFDAAGGVVAGLVLAVQAQGSARTGQVERQELVLGARRFDLLVHHNGTGVVAEFEVRSDDGATERTGFAALAYASMGRLRQQRSIDALLDTAVAELRTITGFDRVMGYRFRHDASGDVVAEARREDLEPYLHRRYPASDIPVQARRLYVLNTVRQIADVPAAPVPVRSDTAEPLDMSWCSLRSVSPIHIEYLTNMGVAASMSVSIVIHGQLWGMLACHHMNPKVVPYAVRTAADVLGQLLASSVQTLLAGEHARQLEHGTALRVRIIEQVTHADGVLDGLKPFAQELCDLFGAQALVATEGTEIATHGHVDPEAAKDLVRWLGTQGLASGTLTCTSLAGLPAPLAASLAPLCGLLALRTEAEGSGWLVLLREEQVETVRWGGRPEKAYAEGPNGPRLTPRGSFDVWREEVRGTITPWTPAHLELATALHGELVRASAARQVQMARARDQMFAVLGHDLRNPLQTITMASQMLELRGGDSSPIYQRISRSSSQMARLIADVLDVSRLQAGLGLGVQHAEVDLSVLVRQIAQDMRHSHPGVDVELGLPQHLPAQVDAGRITQLMDNLLGNARQHGELGRPLRVGLRRDGPDVVIEVANHGPRIPDEVAQQLFVPYKKQSVGNRRNPGGMGLGLYITKEIAQAHGGSVDYAYEAPEVVFRVRLPAARRSDGQ